MSQAGIISKTTGPVPPFVPTTFVTDSGNAIPVLNTLNVVGATGITTTGAGSTITIKLANSGKAFTTTVGATTSQVTIINLGATASIGLFVTKVVGWATTGNVGVAYYIIRSAKTDGTTASLVGDSSPIEFEDTLLEDADATATVNGNAVTITVLGVAGYTIDWTLETTFTAS